jgi:hypothetical protein
MNKKMILVLLGIAFIAGLGISDDLVPVAVSPGAENGPALVRQSCPTFSWTAVSWALTYKVVVFEATDGEAPAYEKIAATATPVLVKEIPGKAFSWTPSADEPLINGGSYVWYVGAMVNDAQGSWSEGRKFIIAESPAWGVVSEPREDGIGAGGSRQILRDKDLELTAAAKESFSLTDDPMIQDLIDIEGTEGASNTFYGSSAGHSITDGINNAFFGKNAGYDDATGNNNTFIGHLAGRYNTASNNTFLGYLAGYATKTGEGNTFIGQAAGRTNTTGKENTFLGDSSGYSNSKGEFNAFFGAGSGRDNTQGKYNAFVGAGSGCKNTEGNYNTFVGSMAGFSNKIGVENTFLGDYAGNLNTGSGNVFVGNLAGSADTTGSNRLYIDNDDDPSPLIYGEFNNKKLNFNAKLRINPSTSDTITLPTHKLEVGVGPTGGAYCDGDVWTDGSSREYKENIEELTSEEAQRTFEQLEPVKFNYKQNKEEQYLGFIAEDVPDLVAMNDRKGLNPMDLVAMLTKVVQDQQKAILELQKKISKLEKRSREEK